MRLKWYWARVDLYHARIVAGVGVPILRLLMCLQRCKVPGVSMMLMVVFASLATYRKAIVCLVLCGDDGFNVCRY